MKFLFKLVVRGVLFAAAVVLVWGCAAPLVKKPADKPVKKEVRKVEKKQPKVQRKQRKSLKHKTEKRVQSEVIEESEITAETVDEPMPEGDAPMVVGRIMFYYDYYPDVGVYFDTMRHLYFYFDNGRWKMSVALPAAFQKRLGRSVQLKIKSDRPFINHDEHLRLYPPLPENPGF